MAAFPPPVVGKQYMVVSAQHYATKVGLNILQQGGNAVDAAVAMGYALAVVYPCCGNIGGGGFMLIRFSDGKSTFIDFREKAPLNIKKGQIINKNGEMINSLLGCGHIQGSLPKPYLAIGIPGTVMGLNRALRKYGSMPLKKVMAPAISLAENGFMLLPGDVSLLKTLKSNLKQNPMLALFFLKGVNLFKLVID